MTKYKQNKIPETTKFEAKTTAELKNSIKEFYKINLQGKEVINKHIGITIKFTSDGLGKITSLIGTINSAAIKIIYEMLENAEYSNFGQRKNEDKQNVIGYLNFKAKGIIDNKLYHFRIAVKLKTDMKAYYNHTVNRYEGWDK